MKSTLLDRRRRNRALLLLGVSATVIGLAMPARAQVDTVSYGDGDVNTTPIVMTRQTVGNVAPDEAATQSGAISGAYKFSKAGFGTLILSGANTFSGGLDVNMGTIVLAHRNAAGTGPISMLDGTRLRFDLNDFGLTNQVNLTGTAEFMGDRVTASGLISGDGRLLVNADLTLSGNNTYSGGTDLATGRLTPLSNLAFGTGAVTMAHNTILYNSTGPINLANDFVLVGSNRYQYFQTGNTLTLTGVVSGAGNLVKTGAGTLVLSGNNTYTGGTSLQGGAVTANSDSAFGSSDIYFQQTTRINYAAGVTLANSLQTGSASGAAVLNVDTGTATHSGGIWGSALGGGYSKTGNGELVITGITGFGGNTNIVGGTLTGGEENSLGVESLHVLGANTRLRLAASQQIGGISGGTTTTLELGDSVLTLDPQKTTSTFQGSVTGSEDSGIVMVGSRLLSLDGDNESYTGFLRIENGPVSVDGDFSGMRVIQNGGTLSGNGRLDEVVINGGVLAGYDGTRLTMDALSLGEDAHILAQFGAMSDLGLFNVNGDLVLDGTLDIEDVGGFDPGIYRLFDYGGRLTDNGLDIGAVPAGYTSGDLKVQTSVPGQVNVLHASAGIGDTLFWDGGDSALWNNGLIDGGSGTWGNGHTSFTTADGIANSEQSPTPGFVVFAGKAGQVDIPDSVAVTGMQFATSGYSIEGGMIELADGENIVRVGDGTAAGEDYVATISASFTGSGTLVKSDRGTLVLNNNRNEHFGGTEVRGGTLEVNGVITEITVGENGRLQGSGAVGDALIGGTIRAGSAYPKDQSLAPAGFGVLSVRGDLTLTDTSRFEVMLDAAGNAGLVDVDGTAYLGGQVFALASGGDYSAGVDYTILRAEGGIDGVFDGVGANLAFLEASLAYNENDVRLHLARNATLFADIAQTANQRATAGAVDAQGAGNVLYDRVLTFDAADARSAFDQLSGEAQASVQGAILAAGQGVSTAMEDRVAAAFARLGAVNDDQAKVGVSLWSSAAGSLGVLEANGNAGRTGFSAGNLFIGADAMFNQNWMFGAMMGFGQTGVSMADRGATASSSNYHAGVYGGGEIENVTLKFGAAYSQHEMKVNRTVTMPGFTESLFSSRMGGTGQAFGEIGYKFAFDSGLILEPFVNLAHASLYTGGFAEQGGASALSGGGQHVGTTSVTIGLRGETTIALGEIEARAHGMVGWRHAIGLVNPTSTHSFSNGAAFAVAGSSLAQDAAIVQAGLDFNLSPNIDLGVAYDGQIGSGLQQHGVRANLSVKF
jgi:autotransporter-associated beta strand protein